MRGGFPLTAVEGADDDWPERGAGKLMTRAEECLRCPICDDFFTNAIELKCAHVFCSLCIRKHFDQKLNHNTSDICPVCRTKADLKSSRVSHMHNNFIAQYISARSELIRLFTDKSEACAATTVNRTSVGNGKVVVQSMNVPHFHSMNKSKVKALLSSLCEGMSAHAFMVEGEKEVMERRYRDIVHLNNAQLGALRPLSLEQVVAEVQRNEVAARAERAKDSSRAPHAGRLQSTAHFSALIRAAKERKQQALQRHLDGEVKEEAGEEKEEGKEDDDEDDDALVVDEWRVVMSEEVQMPFFFNTRTNIGQFEVPPALRDSDLLRALDAEHELASESAHFGCDGSIVLASAAGSPSALEQSFEYSMGTATSEFDTPALSAKRKHSFSSDETRSVPMSSTASVRSEVIDVTASPLTGWTCITCTYVNHDMRRSTCEICGHKSSQTDRSLKSALSRLHVPRPKPSTKPSTKPTTSSRSTRTS